MMICICRGNPRPASCVLNIRGIPATNSKTSSGDGANISQVSHFLPVPPAKRQQAEAQAVAYAVAMWLQWFDGVGYSW